MAGPIPYVVSTSAAVASAPDGAIPINLYQAQPAAPNAVNGLYLPSQTCLFKWRQRRSLTVTGAQQAHVAIIGDSIADGAAVTSPRPVNSWPGVLRAMLARQYGDAGTGLVIMDENLRANPTRDPRVTWAGVITDLAAGFHKQACARIDGPGGPSSNYVTFTPTQAVEAFTVWNLKGAGGANRYQIDSDTIKTFRNVPHVYSDVQPRAGDNAGHYVQTMQAASKGVHTLKVWPDSNAAGYDLFLTAVEGFNDDPGTFRVSNPSISGRSLWSLFGGASMNDETVAWAGLPLIDMLRADLLVVALGVNDWLTGISVSDAKAWLKTLVQRQRGSDAAPGGGTKANGDVLLLWNPQPDISTLGPTVGGATWDQYRAMFYEVADEEDVALLDLGMRWGGFDNADSLGFYLPADHIHPIDAPTRDMAVAVHSALHA